jgi:exoribonuclease-2
MCNVRNGKMGAGVILQETVVDNRIKLTTFTRSGTMWDHASQDVFFVIPNFIPTDLMQRCGNTLLASSPAEQAARVQVLREVVNLEREAEQVRNSTARAIDALYGRLRHADAEQWAHCTLRQVAGMIKLPVQSEALKLLAVHRHLMRRNDQFVANPLSYRYHQTIDVRPQAHLDIMHEVKEMTRERSPALDSFLAKAKVVMARARETRLKTWHEPAAAGAPHADITYTPEEQKIVRFLQLAFHKRQWVQEDPYAMVQVYIAQRLLDTDKPVDNGDLYEMMTDLGLVSPWDDLALREHEELSHYSVRATPAQQEAEGAIVQRFLDTNKDAAASPATQSTSSLGPEDLYTRDPLESIRHDFGDASVYVVDDGSAVELDDGFSLEECPGEPGSAWVHIHIADPTAIIPPTHVFAQRARELGQTMYATNGTMPMLPPALIQSRVSLGAPAAQGLPQNVLTFSVKIDADGEIADYKIQAGIVRNVHVLRYEEDVNPILGVTSTAPVYPFGEPPVMPPSAPQRTLPEADVRALRRLYDISKRISHTRRQLPVFMPFSVEASVSMTQPDLPPSPADLTHPPSFSGFPSMAYSLRSPAEYMPGARQMVAEFMILASRTASRYCVERRIPMVRRTGAQVLTPSDAAFEQLLALRNSAGGVDNISVARLGAVFPPASFSPQPLELWHLGVPRGEGYSRVTSPLRRYEDLLGHYQLKHALLTEAKTGRAAPLYSAAQIAGACAELSYKGVNSKMCGTMDRRFWLLSYIRRWIADPAADRARVNFDALEGTVAAAATRDVLNGNHTARVFFKQLGIYASLLDVPNKGNVPIGETMKMKLKMIEIGHQPRMVVEPA